MSNGTQRLGSVVLTVLALSITATFLWRVFALRADSHGRAITLNSLPAGVPIELSFDRTLGQLGARCVPSVTGPSGCVLFEDPLQLPSQTPRGLRWVGTLTIRRPDDEACRRSRWSPALHEPAADVEVVPSAEPCKDGWQVRAYWYHATPW